MRSLSFLDVRQSLCEKERNAEIAATDEDIAARYLRARWKNVMRFARAGEIEQRNATKNRYLFDGRTAEPSFKCSVRQSSIFRIRTYVRNIAAELFQ